VVIALADAPARTHEADHRGRAMRSAVQKPSAVPVPYQAFQQLCVSGDQRSPRTVLTDDPFSCEIQAFPTVSTGNDFRSEFSNPGERLPPYRAFFFFFAGDSPRSMGWRKNQPWPVHSIRDPRTSPRPDRMINADHQSDALTVNRGRGGRSSAPAGTGAWC
jgi:hypothetical protein